jgi:hypothetical protein
MHPVVIILKLLIVNRDDKKGDGVPRRTSMRRRGDSSYQTIAVRKQDCFHAQTATGSVTFVVASC